MLVHQTLLQRLKLYLMESLLFCFILLAKFFISMCWLKKDDTKVFGLRNWKTVVVIYQFGEEWEQTCVRCGQDRKSKGNQVGISNRLLDIREGIQGRGLVGD